MKEEYKIKNMRRKKERKKEGYKVFSSFEYSKDDNEK